MFYYIFNSFEIGKTKLFKESAIIKFARKSSRSKKIKKINEIDLYYEIENFNEENKLNTITLKSVNPKSYHMINFIEQILVCNFLFKKYSVIILSNGNIKDFDKEKVKYFNYIIIEKTFNNKKCYFKYNSDYKLIKN